jgi:hypothetical protein
MIAAARRQNYGSAARLGRCRPSCMVDYCVYLFYRAALTLLTALPLRFVFSLGNVLGFLAWCFLLNYRRLATRNVEIAFDQEKTTTEKERIVRRHFQRLGANLLSGIKLNALPLSEVVPLVAIEGAETVHRELRAGRCNECAGWSARYWSLAIDSTAAGCHTQAADIAGRRRAAGRVG